MKSEVDPEARRLIAEATMRLADLGDLDMALALCDRFELKLWEVPNPMDVIERSITRRTWLRIQEMGRESSVNHS